eukprot:6190871-Pleurochrysis_carterae.AAC.4
MSVQGVSCDEAQCGWGVGDEWDDAEASWMMRLRCHRNGREQGPYEIASKHDRTERLNRLP